MGTISVSGLIGLYGGMICGILGWWFGRKQARKKRGLDEVYDHIWQKARSYSWYVTLATIYILFSLYLFGVNLHIPMVLGIIMIVHFASWAFIGVGFSIALQSDEPVQLNQAVLGVSLIVVSVLVFTIVSIVKSNWFFMLIGVPISLIGLLFLIKSKKEASD